MANEWPTEADLLAWAGEVSPDIRDLAFDIMGEAIYSVKRKVYTSAVSDDIDYPTECPPDLFRAIIMKAASVWASKAVRSGVRGAGDLSRKASKDGANYSEIISSYRLVVP